MKRIKLFEAFSNSDKIEAANHLLLCWSVKAFIKQKKLKFKIRSNGWGTHVNLTLYYDGCYFDYLILRDELDIHCGSSLKNFLFSKEIYNSYDFARARDLREAAKEVIKKLYHEKN
jgi:hypothetical protein